MSEYVKWERFKSMHEMAKWLAKRKPYMSDDYSPITRHSGDSLYDAFGLSFGGYFKVIPKPEKKKLFAFRFKDSINSCIRFYEDESGAIIAFGETKVERAPEYDKEYD